MKSGAGRGWQSGAAHLDEDQGEEEHQADAAGMGQVRCPHQTPRIPTMEVLPTTHEDDVTTPEHDPTAGVTYQHGHDQTTVRFLNGSKPPAPPPPMATQRSAPGAYPVLRKKLQMETALEENARISRRILHKVTRGKVALFSQEEEERSERLSRIRMDIPRGGHRVGVLSLKGGVGKTTTAISLGATYASLRRERIVAVDANPDKGNLKDRSSGKEGGTVRDLINHVERIETASDVESFMTQDASRLAILASEQDPEKSEAFSSEDYDIVTHVLRKFFALEIVDCGTGVTHPAMKSILKNMDQLVIVSPAAVDGVEAALFVIEWLRKQGYGHLAENVVVVMNRTTEKSPAREEVLKDVFSDNVNREIHIIPHDPRLAGGHTVDLHAIDRETRRAYEALAATVAEAFSGYS